MDTLAKCVPDANRGERTKVYRGAPLGVSIDATALNLTALRLTAEILEAILEKEASPSLMQWGSCFLVEWEQSCARIEFVGLLSVWQVLDNMHSASIPNEEEYQCIVLDYALNWFLQAV